MGPEFSSLDENLEQGIYTFIESLGINNELLGQIYQFSVAYEHQFYVKWLKDLKSLVWFVCAYVEHILPFYTLFAHVGNWNSIYLHIQLYFYPNL